MSCKALSATNVLLACIAGHAHLLVMSVPPYRPSTSSDCEHSDEDGLPAGLSLCQYRGMIKCNIHLACLGTPELPCASRIPGTRSHTAQVTTATAFSVDAIRYHSPDVPGASKFVCKQATRPYIQGLLC